MKCKVSITALTDIAAQVHRQVFFDNIDPDDLACRESEIVYDWYYANWFFHDKGDIYFTPPAFEFRDGHLLGINGRHRAVLLSRHLEIFPMLLVMPETWPEEKIIEVIHKRLKEGETVDLPDLPIKGDIK